MLHAHQHGALQQLAQILGARLFSSHTPSLLGQGAASGDPDRAVLGRAVGVDLVDQELPVQGPEHGMSTGAVGADRPDVTIAPVDLDPGFVPD